MFCPKCNQQQISEDVRFCSRCGLPLQFIAELLASDGIPQTNQLQTIEPAPLFRRKGVRIGAKIIFLSAVLSIPALALSIAFDHPFPLLLAVIPCLIGVAQILYMVLFGESIIPLRQEKQITELNSGGGPLFSLPNTQHMPFDYSSPVITNELKQPASVIENTTKLLKDERN